MNNFSVVNFSKCVVTEVVLFKLFNLFSILAVKTLDISAATSDTLEV